MSATAAEYAASLRKLADLIDTQERVAAHIEAAHVPLSDMFMPVGQLKYGAQQVIDDMTVGASRVGCPVYDWGNDALSGIAINLGAFKLIVFADTGQVTAGALDRLGGAA